ncbi:hypothetical protein JST97_34155 [bacterium]|nr:hypothetical protein [bacterium]
MFFIMIGAVSGYIVSVVAGRMGIEDILSNPLVTTIFGAFLGGSATYGM